MNLIELQQNPARFRDALLIDTDSGPRLLREVMDDWQREDFEALDSGWKRAVGGSTIEATHQRGWLERPRGHSKSGDLGVMAAWALFAARRPLSGIAAAGDQDQARLLRDAIGRLLYVNPWLASILEVQANRVVNTRTTSTLEIITSDAPSSYGLTPDFVICDEVVHWRKRDLWDSLISSAAKRKTCMVACITNAGLSDDWAWNLREAVRTGPGWYFSRLDGPRASWIDAALLEEQERLLPSIAFRRLWLNEWTSGGGDALTPEDIAAAFVPGLGRLSGAIPGYQFVGGMDLGVTRDASAVCVLGIRRSHLGHGRIRLAHTRVWKPAGGRKVDLQDVEASVRELHQRFGFQQLNFDPWEARHMASRLQAEGVGRLAAGSRRGSSLPMVEIPPTGKNLQAIATAVIESFNDRRVEPYDDPDLKRDLYRLRVEERSYGFRLVSPRDEHGHGDMATAFGHALLAATELAARRQVTAGVPSKGVELTPIQRELRNREFLSEMAGRERDRPSELGPDDSEELDWLMRLYGRRQRLIV